MTEIIPLIFIMTLLSMMSYLLVRHLRCRELEWGRHVFVSAMLLVNLCLMVTDYMAGGDIAVRISLDLILLVFPILLLSSPVWTWTLVRRICMSSASLQICLAIYYLLCRFGFLLSPSTSFYIMAVSAVSIINAVLICLGTWYRIRNIRDVMRSGTVQNILGLELELVYSVAIQTLSIVLLAVISLCEDLSDSTIWIPPFLELILLVALCIRSSEGTFFVILQGHERRILESLKIAQVEITAGEKKNNYRELYERLVAYFEKEKPYLDSNLSINDVVRVVFSNKVYISRAISQYTGRNFCQFVNYYRISYSMECFRMNPELKITEMSEMSGFNSVVTYNTAFRLFMNENPGEWCRKERHKINNKKK